MGHCVDWTMGSLWHAELASTLSEDDVSVAYWQRQPPPICLVSERWMSPSRVLWDLAVVGTAAANRSRSRDSQSRCVGYNGHSGKP